MINYLADLGISGKFTLFTDDLTILYHDEAGVQLNKEVNRDVIQFKKLCD